MYNDMYMNNPYGNTFNPVMQQPMMPAQRREVDRLNGRNGAEMFRMAPNSSVLLLDENEPIIWFVKTDSAGYKTIMPYDIAPHVDEPLPDVKGIDERLNSIDERLKTLEEALK